MKQYSRSLFIETVDLPQNPEQTVCLTCRRGSGAPTNPGKSALLFLVCSVSSDGYLRRKSVFACVCILACLCVCVCVSVGGLGFCLRPRGLCAHVRAKHCLFLRRGGTNRVFLSRMPERVSSSRHAAAHCCAVRFYSPAQRALPAIATTPTLKPASKLNQPDDYAVGNAHQDYAPCKQHLF